MRGTTRRRALVAVTAAVGVLLTPTTADAAVTCGQVITTSTTLDHDLDCDRTGIAIGASNVVLDLNGHTITGPGADAAWMAGVNVQSGVHRAVVRNGTIRNYPGGVFVNPDGSGTQISGLRVEDALIGIAAFSGSRSASITRNTVLRATGNAIQVGGDDHRIERNTLIDAASGGISFSGHRNVVVGNTVTGSGANGIALSPFPNQATPLTGNEISRNRIAGSGHRFSASSISIHHAAETVVRSNTIEGLGQYPGVFVRHSTGTHVSSNRIESQGDGVLVRGTSAGTTVEANIVTGSSFGIVVSTFEGTPTGTQLIRNIVGRNRFDGLRLGAPDATATGNVAHRNGQWGIFAVNGVTDGGGNRAVGNGVPSQCTPNIAC